MKNFFQRVDYHWGQVSWRRFLILPSSFASSCCTNLASFIVNYHFDTQGISFLQRRTKKWNWDKIIARQRITHHQYVWKGLRARESCGGRCRPARRCCDDHPLQSSLMSSRSWGRQLLCESSNMRNGNIIIDLLWRFEVAKTQWWLTPCLRPRCCWLFFAQLLR